MVSEMGLNMQLRRLTSISHVDRPGFAAEIWNTLRARGDIISTERRSGFFCVLLFPCLSGRRLCLAGGCSAYISPWHVELPIHSGSNVNMNDG